MCDDVMISVAPDDAIVNVQQFVKMIELELIDANSKSNSKTLQLTLTNLFGLN